MQDGKPPTTPTSKATPSKSATTAPVSSANGEKQGGAGKAGPPGGRGGGGGGEGLAGIAAKMMGAKGKKQESPETSGVNETGRQGRNGCVDDLPLGSEAHSLSQDQTNGIDSRNLAPADKRYSLSNTGVMGWQSFNSDVSNQTSASSASLEMLLNERQVDPEEMLLNLGFGGQGQSYVPYLARVPQRFLHHPSRAYGIDLPDVTDRVDGEGGDETVTGTPVGNSGTSAAAPPAKKRTGIWTLARTLSLMRVKPRNPLGHISPTATPCGTPPLTHQPHSILHPSNQKYLASRGYYMQQGWPRGTFEEPDEDLKEIAEEEEETSKDAASKRKMFKKNRSRRNWSLCDSGDNENVPPSSKDLDWMTQSMDDSISREDYLGRGHYFSTTTESSTDSLDTPNLETERAFEEIRRQYNESRKKERSSSEDLFMPKRKKRLSSDIEENDHNYEDEEEEEHGLDLLSANDSGKNYFISPASSRQTTIEKAPTISEHSMSILGNEESELDGQRRNDDNNNKTKDKGTDMEDSSLLKNKSFSKNEDGSINTNSEVRIIVSSSDSYSAKDWSNPFRMKSPSKLTVEGTQRASSDSGSSSSGTAVGSNVATCTEDTDTPRLSESESVTDKDSISRTHSPYGFSHSPDRSRQMVTNSCQTSDTDFNLAAAAAANQAVNVTTITASNTKGGRQSTGVDNEKDRQGQKLDDQGHKIQLSSLPPSINPLELMKRLRHSQDELSRMGSVQSDSSGFGDSDMPAESGPQDTDQLKVASLGSSMESSTTLASSATTAIMRAPPRGEVATQTSVESSMGKPRNIEEKSRHKESPRPTGEGARYVTMCYIPSLMPRNDQDGLRQRSRGYSIDVAADLRHRPLDHDGVGYSRYDGYNEFQPDHRTHFNSDYDLRRGGYNDSRSSSGRINSSTHSHHQSPGFERYRNQVSPHYPYTEVNNVPTRNPPVYSQKDFMVGDPNRRFTSQLDLYQGEAGLQKKEVSYYTHSPRGPPRRFSDDGILERNSKIDRRNDTPLSEELALAMGSGRSPSASSTARTQPVSSTSSNIVSSKSIFIQSGPTITTTLPTPAKFKTQAGFHFPPLAGNLSGLRMEQHSTPVSSARSPPKSRQRSCDILEDDFTDGEPISSDHGHFQSGVGSSYLDYSSSFRDSPTLPKRNVAPGGFSSWHEWAHHSPAQPYTHSLPPGSHSRTSDDLETYSSIAESSSDFSIQSTPEGLTKAGILDSRKLAKLINQPIYFKGKRRAGSHYQPRRLFKEWTLLSKRKRLQEENRLLQYALQKYKTELSIMETSFIVDCQAVYSDLTDEERAEIEELEWLWSEVRGQVLEMERLLLARVKSVHAGNDFHSLMSNMGVINKMIDVIKEQIYQQQIANNRAEDEEEEDDDDDDLEMYEDFLLQERRRGSSHSSSHSWMAGMGRGSNSRRTRHFHSSSTSNLPADLNVSLEQMKSSLLSQVHSEIKESTKKLEMDLQEKDREIKELKAQLNSSNEAIGRSPRRWTPKSTPSRSRSLAKGQQATVRSRSRPRVVGDRIVHETDV